jgi:EmrB/QacA subfamily drug resistance transporter
MANAMHDQGREVPPPLGRHVVTVAAIVATGAVMTLLDLNIVSLAINTLSRDFKAPLSTIQWVISGYTLALTAVIPLTGWGADRFGGKRLWMLSLALFTAGSVLCGVAWSATSLIVFRVIQGLGGGMVAPTGMSLVAQAAGHKRMGRAISLVTTPIMLAPIVGPAIGGTLISQVSWRWIFYLNVPICAVALLWSWRTLDDTPARRGERLDLTGLVLLCPGLVGLVYGVSSLSMSGGFGSPNVLISWFGGLALLAGFVVHARRASRPLLDLGLFAHKTFATVSILQVLLGAVLIGVMLPLPLYFQIVRGQTPLHVGLLLIPQGAGAAVAMAIVGRLIDKGIGRIVALCGLILLVAGFIPYALSTATTSYVLVLAALFVIGLGMGAVAAPVMSAGYRSVDRATVPRATSTLQVLQRVGGAIGTAVYAVMLQHYIAQAQPGGAAGLAGRLADAFGKTFWVALAISAVCVLPALFLPGRPPAGPRTAPAGHDQPSQMAADTTQRR